MRSLLMVLLLPLIKLAALLAGLWPRDRHTWVFGSYKNSFTDNSKYLFIHLTVHHPEIRAVWISANDAVIAQIRAAGGRAFRRWSLPGIAAVLRARYWFVSAYVSDINAYLSRGAELVNLWHGVPLKKIEFDIENGPLARQFHAPSFLERHLFNAALFRKPDWVLSTSPFVSESSFASAFRVPAARCLNLGYPRLDPFSWDEASMDRWLERWGSASLRALRRQVRAYDRVFIYMPTWRDANPNFFGEIGFDFAALNTMLSASNSVLILKLHPATPAASLDAVRGLSHVLVMETHDDVYPLLPLTTALISDYSSIYLDYLALDRPICFFIFDLQNYLSASRGFYYAYDEVTPGIRATTPGQVLEFMRQDEEAGHAGARAALKARFFSHGEGGASERIVNHFKPKQ